MPQDQLTSAARRIARQHLMARRIARRYLMQDRARRIASLWMQAEADHQRRITGMEFDTEEARKKYLKKHPGADPKRHTVKERGEGKEKGEDAKATREKLKSFMGKLKGVSKSMVQAIKNAPENTQKFVADPAYRNKQAKAAAQSLKKVGKAGAKAIWNGAKTEAKGVFVDTPKILIGLSTGKWYDEDKKEWISERRKPTKQELKTLYGTAVYAGGVALTMMGGPAGAMFTKAGMAAGATAFANSFTLHMAFRSIGNMIQEGVRSLPDADSEVGATGEVSSEVLDAPFLGYEALETLATGAGAAGVKEIGSFLPSSSALYAFSPWTGLTKVLDVAKEVGSMVLGAEKDEKVEDVDQDKLMEEFIHKLMGSMADVLEKGISDEDMTRILKEEHGPDPDAKPSKKEEKEAARQYEPLDSGKNDDYGGPYKNEYNWKPENRGKGRCFYETHDERDRCYVTTNGGPGGQTKPSTGDSGKDHSPQRSDYNKEYRKQRLKKGSEDLIPLNWLPLPEAT